MLATLPMYDWPEVWAENDTLWAAMRDALRAEGIDAPDALDRRVGYEESWTRSDLVLGEVCGLPYIKGLSEDVSLIGAMDLKLEGCPPGFYRSHIIVAAESELGLDDLKGRDFAFNTECSQSGLATLRKLGLAEGRGQMSGGHRASIQLVAEGRATFAAIDAHTWEIALKHEPRCEAVRVIANTPPTPGPVYIAAKGADVEAYRRALPSVIPVTADDYKSLF